MLRHAALALGIVGALMLPSETFAGHGGGHGGKHHGGGLGTSGGGKHQGGNHGGGKHHGGGHHGGGKHHGNVHHGGGKHHGHGHNGRWHNGRWYAGHGRYWHGRWYDYGVGRMLALHARGLDLGLSLRLRSSHRDPLKHCDNGDISRSPDRTAWGPRLP